MLSEFDSSLPSSPSTKSGVLSSDISTGFGNVIENSTFVLQISKSDEKVNVASSLEESKCERAPEDGDANPPLTDDEEEPNDVDDADLRDKKVPPVPTRNPKTRLSSSSDRPSPLQSTSSSSLSVSSDAPLSDLPPENSETSLQPEIVCVNGVVYVPVNYEENAEVRLSPRRSLSKVNVKGDVESIESCLPINNTSADGKDDSPVQENRTERNIICEDCDVDNEVFNLNNDASHLPVVHNEDSNSKYFSSEIVQLEKRSSPTIINVVQDEHSGNVGMNVLSEKDKSVAVVEMSDAMPFDEFDSDNSKFKTVKMLIRLGQLEGLDEKPPSFKPPPPPHQKNQSREIAIANNNRDHQKKQESSDVLNRAVVAIKNDDCDRKSSPNVHNEQSSPVPSKKADSSRRSSASRNATEKNDSEDVSVPAATTGRENKGLSTFGSNSKCERNFVGDSKEQSQGNVQPLQLRVSTVAEADAKSVPASETVKKSRTPIGRFNIYGEMSSSSTEDVLSENCSGSSRRQTIQSPEKPRSRSPSPFTKERPKKKKETKKMSKKKKKMEEEQSDISYKIPEPLVEELEARIKTRTMALDDSAEQKDAGADEQSSLKEPSLSKDDGVMKERKHRWKSLWRKKTPEKDDI